MTVYRLSKQIAFPNPEFADDDGLLAIGGDLNPERLILAYAQGIFPWYNQNPIMWWSPNPRMILYPEKFKVSKSLQQILKQNKFQIKIDSCFKDVIENCKTVNRSKQDGTWITAAMKKAYIQLHEIGVAHSFEVFRNEKLVGGLYGISLGSAFFGESMFHFESNASKFAFYYLCEFAIKNKFQFIDCQVANPHLESLGAEEISRLEFLQLLEKALENETLQGKWK
jgi:leucyl/phenylalanyl-tRNA--protein transferase